MAQENNLHEPPTSADVLTDARMEGRRLKISEWLLANVDSHDILEHEGAAKDFTKATGLQPCWPVHSRQTTIDTMARRGVGGHISEGLGANAWGYEVAEALAKKYAPGYRCTKLGRGYVYREALEALRAAGL